MPVNLWKHYDLTILQTHHKPILIHPLRVGPSKTWLIPVYKDRIPADLTEIILNVISNNLFADYYGHRQGRINRIQIFVGIRIPRIEPAVFNEFENFSARQISQVQISRLGFRLSFIYLLPTTWVNER